LINENSNKRIALVGDSIAFGYGVSDNETLTANLNQLSLNKKAKFLNFGIIGYGLHQYPELIQKKVSLFHPQTIILQLFSNDLVNSFYLLEKPTKAKKVDKNFKKIPELKPNFVQKMRSTFLTLREQFYFVKFLNPFIKNILSKLGIVKKVMVNQTINTNSEIKHKV
jgi:lysophospholipase L1-like esterase